MTDRKDEADRPYTAAIGDLVKSRSLSDRASVQRKLLGTVKTFNEEEGESLAAPVKLTAGDEVQAVLEDPSAAVELVSRISEELHPVPIVWGLGHGSVTTDWTEDVSTMDGPCFHHARQALKLAADDDLWLTAEGFSPTDDQVLSALFRLMGALRSSWTETQIRYIRALRGRSQQEVAEQFDVSEGAVSRALRRARFQDVREGEAAARELLATYREEHDSRSADGRNGQATGRRA